MNRYSGTLGIFGIIAVIFLITGTTSVALVFPAENPLPPPVSPPGPDTTKLGHVQIPFIKNTGQFPDTTNISFYASTFAGTVFAGTGGITYIIPSNDTVPLREITESFEHNRPLIISTGTPSGSTVNYFVGNDPDRWRTDIPTYDDVSFGEVAEGVSLKIRAYGRNVEKLFTIAPGTDIQVITVHVSGINGLQLSDSGALRLNTDVGTIEMTEPKAYQLINDRQVMVDARYIVRDTNTYGFTTGNYDKNYPLVIDPLLASTYLGGINHDYAQGIAIDPFTGAVYIAGNTASPLFPTTPGAYNRTYGSPSWTGAVSKFSSDLSTLQSSTFLGGSSASSSINAIGFDLSSNSVYIAGQTAASDFPITAGVYCQTYSGSGDGFISALSADLGSLGYSTYIGGSSSDVINDMSIWPGNEVVITGQTNSLDFQTTALAYCRTYSGGSTDSFVTILNPPLTSALLSTYLGGSGAETGYSIFVDTAENAYVTGSTDSTNFPTTAGAYCRTYTGSGTKAFVSKFSTLAFSSSTYLGGSSNNIGYDITANGDLFIAGRTESSDFPTTAGAYCRTYVPVYDGFIVRMPPTLDTIFNSTYLGGGTTTPHDIKTDSAFPPNVYVSGQTTSSIFPTIAGAFQTSINGPADGFISRLNQSLTNLTASTFIGGSGTDDAYRMGIFGGNVYVAGNTDSSDFPTTAGAYSRTNTGLGTNDWFVSKLDPVLSASPPAVTGITPASGVHTGTVAITNLAGTGFQSGTTVKLTKAGQTDIIATNVVVVPPTKITCDFDLTGKSTGMWNVVVTNPDAQSGTLPGGFTVRVPAPVAGFTAAPRSGPAPLSVSFTDSSSNTPDGWAWFFGDENYTEPWTEVSAGAGWIARWGHSSVAMPDGSIVLIGGFAGGRWNDTWLSTDMGATWANITGSPGWTARFSHSSVVMPDGSIVLMGGFDSFNYFNDVWRSTNNGTTWMLANATPGWTKRACHSSVVMPDGSIVLMGGDTGVGMKNDVWRSMNNGATWTQQTAAAGWSPRYAHSSVVMPDGSIVLIGGMDSSGIYYKNDTWQSKDNGATWINITGTPAWTARYYHSSVAMPDGSIVLMGGVDSRVDYKNDVWRSTDNGTTWTEVNASARWSGRAIHSSVAMPDGSIVLMGGDGSGGSMNDVWRLMPAGLSLQNPSHTYTVPGIYSVALQAYNAGGFNSLLRTGYITVAAAVAPVANFTGTPTSGTAPLAVTFTDTSTGSPTSWNWSFGDGSFVNATMRNPVHTYAAAGTYTVSLNATNIAGYNTTSKPAYITVTAASAAPVAAFSGIPTTGTAPLNVTFTDSSTNSPTEWNWSFGDGSYCETRNPSHIYTGAGTFTVSLNATNTAGSNTISKAGYITVSSGGGDGGGNGGGGGGDGGGGGEPAEASQPAPEPQQPPAQPPPEQPAPEIAPLTPEEQPVEGLAGLTFTESYPVGFEGMSFNADGQNSMSLDISAAEQAGATITTYFDRVEVYQHGSPGVRITFFFDSYNQTAKLISGIAKRAEFETDPLVINVSAGKVAGSVHAVLTSINQPVKIENTITGNVTVGTAEKFRAVLAQDNLAVAGIAYLMDFQRGKLTSTGASNVTMTVPASWVDSHGGKDAVRIARISDTTGITELIDTVFTGADSGGNMVFRGDSPAGTSIFGLLTAKATTAKQMEEPNVTIQPLQKPAVMTEIGMFAWLLGILKENPVVIVVIIAVVGVVLYLTWKRRQVV